MTMKIDWMRGCATALVTPFKADGAIDEERMRALVDRQIDGGVQLLVPCGTTGESATMTEDEDARVIALTIEVARGRAKVIAGAGSNSTASAIEYSKRARELGADAVLQVAPWYNKPTQEGLYAHFQRDCRAIPDLPDHALQRAGPHFVEHRRADDAAAGARLRKHRGGQRSVGKSFADHGNSARTSGRFRGVVG